MLDIIVPVAPRTNGCPEKPGGGPQAIRACLDAHNADPKPFRWSAPADTIIGKHQRGKPPLDSLH